jgi:hypothetical protein
MTHDDPWAPWLRLYRDFFRPFLLLPVLAGVVGVTWLLLPDLAGVVAACCGIYWAWMIIMAMRARWLMLYWLCPKCHHPFLRWPYYIRVFSDNRCGSCGVRAGEG